jgi:hypothetical protein
MKSGHINNFKHLSKFSSLKDFNNNIEQWMIDIKSSFTKSELIALKRLIRFAAKIPGICNAKIQTIISATHEKNEMGGISRSTFERMLRKVENTMRYGKQGHNVYVFNPYVAQEDSSSNEIEVPETIDGAENSLSSKTHNQLNNRTESATDQLISDIIPSWINKEFVQYASHFFHAKDIIEFARITLVNSKKHDLSASEIDTSALESFKQLVYKIKHSTVRNAMGLYTAIIRQKLRTAYVREMIKSIYLV